MVEKITELGFSDVLFADASIPSDLGYAAYRPLEADKEGEIHFNTTMQLFFS
jgi:hypothetical protein